MLQLNVTCLPGVTVVGSAIKAAICAAVVIPPV
jgi:hypothetical protein